MTLRHGLADDHSHFDLEKSQEYFTLNRTLQFLKDIQLIKSFVASGSLLDVGSFLRHLSRHRFPRGMSRSRHRDRRRVAMLSQECATLSHSFPGHSRGEFEGQIR